MSSTILPRPSDPSLDPTFSYNAAGQKIHSTRYSNYQSLVKYTTYLRVLEDIIIVPDLTPGYSSARETLHGYNVLNGLKKGDIVMIVERRWEDYWLGECNGRRGFFLMDNRFAFVLTSTVRTIWSRSSERENELGFPAGVELHLLYPHDYRFVWAMTATGNDVGLVPFTFIESIPPDPPSSVDNSISPPTSERPYGNQEWIPSEIINAKRAKVRALWPFDDYERRFLRLRRNDIIEILAQTREEWWIGLIITAATEENSETVRIGMFPQNHVHSSLTRTPSPILGRALAKPPWTPYHVRAIYSKETDHSYELRLERGDVIEVETICEDRWWRGQNRNGDGGWFPENYVSPVLSRFQPLRRTST